MGYHPTTKSRAYKEGWAGRRRNYKCRGCGEKFCYDGGQLPEYLRFCDKCMMHGLKENKPENIY